MQNFERYEEVKDINCWYVMKCMIIRIYSTENKKSVDNTPRKEEPKHRSTMDQTDKKNRKKTQIRNSEYQKVCHEFAPVFDSDSRILILGSFPSVKSREQQFFYGHPQNRFWKVIASLTGYPVPQTIEEKKKMLLENRIAIWDVIQECEIIGSSDSSIRNVVPTDLNQILQNDSIKQIYANGNTAKKLFEKYQKKMYGREIIGLPSTSPANAAFSLEKLTAQWNQIVPEITGKQIGHRINKSTELDGKNQQ